MSKCDDCKKRGDCKERQAFERFQEVVGEGTSCSGYEYEKPLTQDEFRELLRKGML